MSTQPPFNPTPFKIEQKSTTNYALFENNDHNRIIRNNEGDPLFRKDIVQSMKTKGFKRSAPIICYRGNNNKLVIVDGHNRFFVAVHLKLPIEYICYLKEDTLDPVEWSATQKQWALRDYSLTFSQEKSDYLEVENYCRATGIPINTCYGLFAGEVAGSYNQGTKVKHGTFVIKDREVPEKVRRIVSALNLHCSFGSSVYVVGAISKVIHIEGIDLDRLVDRIHRHPELLEKKRTLDDYVDLLELIYNRHTKQEKLYFRAGVDKAMQARRVCKAK